MGNLTAATYATAYSSFTRKAAVTEVKLDGALCGAFHMAYFRVLDHAKDLSEDFYVAGEGCRWAMGQVAQTGKKQKGYKQ